MLNLVEIFNTNDLRWLLDEKDIYHQNNEGYEWLLDSDGLPENYDTEYLIPVLDDIIFEYEDLKGDKFYTNFLRKSDFTTKDAAKLVVLRGCYTLFTLDYKNQAKDLLKQIKSSADSVEKIDFEMKRLTQQLQVRAMKDAGKKNVKQSFGEMCSYISEKLDMSIKNVRDATVAEFIGYEKIIKRKAA